MSLVIVLDSILIAFNIDSWLIKVVCSSYRVAVMREFALVITVCFFTSVEANEFD